MPRSELPRPGDNFAVIDLRSVGVRHLPAAVYRRRLPRVRDQHQRAPGAPELSGRVRHLHRHERRRRRRLRGVQRRERRLRRQRPEPGLCRSTWPPALATAVFYTDADLNSGNVIFTVPMNSSAGGERRRRAGDDDELLGLRVRQLLHRQPDRCDRRACASRRATPRFGVVGTRSVASRRMARLTLDVTTANVSDTLSSELGLLMMYRRNAGQEADRVRLQ